MVLVQCAKEYTIKDIYALADGQRAELIDGQMYMMATPGRIHQELVHQLSWEVEAYIREHKGNCKIYPAPFAVFLNADEKTYVEPDISVICDREKLDDKGCSGAPDWIIEVVSPSTQRMDYLIKLLKYRSAGVKEYWIVDPKDKTVSVYDFNEDDVGKYTFMDRVKAGIFNDLEIDFAKMDIGQ